MNDAPELLAIDDQYINEGGTKVILLSATDVDEDDLIYSITDNENIIPDLDGSTVSFSLINDDYFGSESFTASVTDGEYTSDQSFTVTVANVNDAPVLAFVNDVSFVEDGLSETITLSASDPDVGDMLTFAITGGDNIIPTLADDQLSFTAATDFNGTEVFTVSVEDN